MNTYPEIPLKFHCPGANLPQKLRAIASIAPEIISQTLEIQNLEQNGVDIHFSLPLDRAIELLGEPLGVDFRAEDWTEAEPFFLVEMTIPNSLLQEPSASMSEDEIKLHCSWSSSQCTYWELTVSLRLLLAMAMCQQDHDYTIALVQEKRGQKTLSCQHIA